MDVIEQRKLENNMTLTVHNQSKKMAGDRWLIKIVCEAEIPVEEGFFSRVAEEDLDLQAEVREGMAGAIRFSVIKERTFIAESEREAMVARMVTEIMDNMVVYLNRVDFPERLFARKYAELRESCATARHYRRLPERESEGDADEGPADFSACFKE